MDTASQQAACDLWQREVNLWQPIGQVVPARDIHGKFVLRILGLPTRMDRDVIKFLKSRAALVSRGALPPVPIAYGAAIFMDHLNCEIPGHDSSAPN